MAQHRGKVPFEPHFYEGMDEEFNLNEEDGEQHESEHAEIPPSIVDAFDAPFLLTCGEADDQHQHHTQQSEGEEEGGEEEQLQCGQLQPEEVTEEEEEQCPQSHQEESDGKGAQEQAILQAYHKVVERVQHQQMVVARAAQNVQDCGHHIESTQRTLNYLEAMVDRERRTLLTLREQQAEHDHFEDASRVVLSELEAEQLALCNQYPFLPCGSATDTHEASTMSEL